MNSTTYDCLRFVTNKDTFFIMNSVKPIKFVWLWVGQPVTVGGQRELSAKKVIQDNFLEGKVTEGLIQYGAQIS